MPSFLPYWGSTPPHSPRASSSPCYSPSHLETLPDALLKMVADYLKPVDSIKGIQVANRWALSYFASETKKVVLWSKPLLEERKKAMTYGRWALQGATVLWYSLSGTAAAGPTIDSDVEEERRRHAIVLGSFLSRFPNLIIIQALAADDKELGTILMEVFTRKTFPTVERFENIFQVDGIFFGHVPFTYVASALPNLRMLGIDAKRCFLGDVDSDQSVQFFEQFRTGMFSKVQELQLYLDCTPVNLRVMKRLEDIFILVMEALESREILEGLPCLTTLSIDAWENPSNTFGSILALDSCSKLRHLDWFLGLPPEREDAEEAQVDVASYILRTQCKYLETLSIRQIYKMDDDGFGPIGKVIRDGKATNLRRIEARNLDEASLKNLSDIIDAGLLPNLKELVFFTTPTTAVHIATWTNGMLNPFIETLSLRHELFPPDRVYNLTLFRHVHDGVFPNLKHLVINRFKEADLKSFIHFLRREGIQGAHTLRSVFVALAISERTLQQLRAILPAAEIRRGERESD